MNQDRVERKNVGQSVRFVRVAVSESGTPPPTVVICVSFWADGIYSRSRRLETRWLIPAVCNAILRWQLGAWRFFFGNYRLHLIFWRRVICCSPFERGLWTRLKGYFKTRERLLLGYTWGCQFDYKRSSPTFKFAELSEDMLSPSSWSESNVQRLSPHNVPGSSVRFTGLPPKEETNLTQEET